MFDSFLAMTPTRFLFFLRIFIWCVFVKIIKLQHRTYLGEDRKRKYMQHRINIPDDIIKRLGWNQERSNYFERKQQTRK